MCFDFWNVPDVIQVVSGDTISINNEEVRVPYEYEKDLTPDQYHWLHDRGIEVIRLKIKRKEFSFA